MPRAVRLPSVFRNTPFRLTLLFLALFAASASAFLAYIYGVTAGEVSRRADGEINREIQSLLGTYRQGGMDGLNLALIERTGDGRAFVYLLSDKTGKRMTGTLAESPVDLAAGPKTGDQVAASFKLTQTDPDGALIKSAARGQQAAPQPWYVEAHQFRIDTTDGIGRPTPEGAHRDGVDFVAVILIQRTGIKDCWHALCAH